MATKRTTSTTRARSSDQPAATESAGRRYSRRLKRYFPTLMLVAIGFISGILWLAAIRFLITIPPETHYHANFAVYIDGQREEFKSFTYYEEVAACTSAYADNPKGRVHMHGNVNDVIHVHDKRVTYADFFNNLDWTLGPDFIRTDKSLLVATPEKHWTFELNGQQVSRVDNRIIGDQDKLLLTYGASASDIRAQYDAIENHAKFYDESDDPASCAGLEGAGANGFKTRLDRSFFGN